MGSGHGWRMMAVYGEGARAIRERTGVECTASERGREGIGRESED